MRGGGHDGDSAAVLGLLGPLHDPRVLAELAPHLLDHLAAGAPDGLDREGREQVDHHAADEQADQHRGSEIAR